MCEGRIAIVTIIKKLLMISILLAVQSMAQAQRKAVPLPILEPGSLDPTFGGHGSIITSINESSDGANGIAIQADGKLVVVGYSYGEDPDFAIIRLNVDGSLDTSFDIDGIVTTDFENSWDIAYAVAIQPDGEIVVAGYSDFGNGFALARYTTSGALDTSFHGDGKLTTDFGGGWGAAYAVVMQPDGKIIASGAGYSNTSIRLDFVTARYNTNGSLDTSFDGDGKATTDFSNGYDAVKSIAVTPTGEIVTAGERNRYCDAFPLPEICFSDVAISRYRSDGSLDDSFGTDGKVVTSYGGNDGAKSLAIQADGKIIVAGGPSIIRYDANGSIDPSFGAGGRSTIPNCCAAYAVSIQTRGKIVVAGYQDDSYFIELDRYDDYKFALFRFNSDGSIDSSFGTGGKAITDFGGDVNKASSIAIQLDGKIVAAGFTHTAGDDFAVARYIGDTPVRNPRSDFDGDGKTDISVYRPSDGNWYLNRSRDGISVINWGNATDIPTPGDFDKDGKADAAVFRPSTGQWFILNSTDSSFIVTNWGNAADKPVAADYDGDGKADVAVYRLLTGEWFILRSSNGAADVVQWGNSTDLPVQGNYDSDNKTDIAVYRPSNGTWFVLQSTGGGFGIPWGIAGDKPVPADYDGDGKDDLAAFRPTDGNWYFLKSGTNNTQYGIISWGSSADMPVPGDYDGDGTDDVAVYRPSTGQWFVLKSTSGYDVINWGTADQPIPASYIP